MSKIRFGTDGWRAVMCDTFTFHNVEIVCQAIAEYIKKNEDPSKGVIIGYDARFLSDKFASLAGKVMSGNGIRAYIVERDTPTPVVAHAVLKWQTAGALMFTASHNPPEYNGIKFIPKYAGPAEPGITKAIEEELFHLLENDNIDGKIGSSELIQYIDPMDGYIEELKSMVDLDIIKSSGLRIVYDPLYASGRGYLDKLLSEHGIHLEVLHNNRDPLFGGGSPDPGEGQLGELIEVIRNNRADIGLATDGDADRFGVIDDTGVFLSPNQIICLLLVHLVKNKGIKGSVVRTVATTHMIDAIAERYGLKVYETPVGFKYVSEHMREKRIVIGGEESGGLSVYGHIPEKDGILACLLVAEMRAVMGVPLSQVLRDIMDDIGEYHSRRLDLEYPEEQKNELIRSLREAPPRVIGGVDVVDTTTIDGVKVILANGNWFLIRPSGTEPIIRVYIESSSKEGLESFTEDVKAFIKQKQ